MWENLEELKTIIKNSYNKTEILEKLGLKNHGGNFNTLTSFILENKINIDHFKRRAKRGIFIHYKDINLILTENSIYRSTTHLKNRLYKEGLKERFCEICGQNEEWNGKKISLILDHINGDRHDNRIVNLQIVCPNCNATLDTHCRGLNKKKDVEIHDYCECGDRKKLTSTNCTNCYNKKRKKKEKLSFNDAMFLRRKVERPSLEQLKIDVEELGYCGTGRKYSVSDNSIRKWLKSKIGSTPELESRSGL